MKKDSDFKNILAAGLFIACLILIAIVVYTILPVKQMANNHAYLNYLFLPIVNDKLIQKQWEKLPEEHIMSSGLIWYMFQSPVIINKNFFFSYIFFTKGI